MAEEDGCYHLRCSTHLFLLLPVAGTAAEIVPYCSTPTFSVDLVTSDIEATFNYMERQHVQFERRWEPGKRSFIIRDPDGLIWEIIAERKDN